MSTIESNLSKQANRVAALIMRRCFDIDTSLSWHYQDIMGFEVIDESVQSSQVRAPRHGELVVFSNEALPVGFKIVDSGLYGIMEAVIVAPKLEELPAMPERVMLKRVAALMEYDDEPIAKAPLAGFDIVR